MSFVADSTQQNGKISPNSLISQKKNTRDRLGSSHASSPLFRSNSEINEPIKLRSIHG